MNMQNTQTLKPTHPYNRILNPARKPPTTTASPYTCPIPAIYLTAAPSSGVPVNGGSEVVAAGTLAEVEVVLYRWGFCAPQGWSVRQADWQAESAALQRATHWLFCSVQMK